MGSQMPQVDPRPARAGSQISSERRLFRNSIFQETRVVGRAFPGEKKRVSVLGTELAARPGAPRKSESDREGSV